MSQNKLITAETLKGWRACTDGFRRFCELFPEGADLDTAVEGLAKDGHPSWAEWLINNCRSSNDAGYSAQAQKGFLNSGHRNSGHRNSGNWNSGNWNSGHRNSGDGNSGDRNSGHRNSGDGNSGDGNSGDGNSGNWNSGNWNSGNWNSGNWNSGNWNSGHFNSIIPEDILLFNKPLKRSEWQKADIPGFICDLPVNYWVSENEMTDEEKKADPNFYVRGGQLRRRSYHEAWALAWKNASERDRNRVKALPNFDAAVFKEITGIDVTNKEG